MRSPRANRLVWTVVIPFVAFLGVMTGVWLLTHVPTHWDQWRAATCMPDACFCESIRGGTVRQMANTWSSFAFVLVSSWVIATARFDRLNTISKHNMMSQRLVYPMVFALSLLMVGAGSAFYHASLTFAGQFADVFGMYLIGTFVLLYNVCRLRPLSDAFTVAGYLTLNVVLALLLYFVPETRRYLFAVVIVAALFAEYLVRRRGASIADLRYLVAAVSALVLACVLWSLDLRRVVCSAESLWQGHAAWHVLGAVACGAMYVFWRSESGGDRVVRPTSEY